MTVRVDKTGADDFVLAIDNVAIEGCFEIFSNLDNHVILNEHIVLHCVELVVLIEEDDSPAME